MTEYIEREAVLKIIDDNCPKDKGGYNTEEEIGAGVACCYIRKAVENIPTDDVVEVVRCKDCRFYESNCCFNRQWDMESSTEIPLVRETDFCSYGERKE